MLWLIFASLSALVCAEVGLVARSSNAEINNKEIRLVDGQLCIGQGPILQGFFNSQERFVISPRLISANFSGAGIGLNHAQQLVVSLTAADGLTARAGWLEYDESPVFYFAQTKSGWMLHTSPGVESMNFVPSMLQIADIEYEGEYETPKVLAAQTEPLTAEEMEEQLEDYGMQLNLDADAAYKHAALNGAPGAQDHHGALQNTPQDTTEGAQGAQEAPHGAQGGPQPPQAPQDSPTPQGAPQVPHDLRQGAPQQVPRPQGPQEPQPPRAPEPHHQPPHFEPPQPQPPHPEQPHPGEPQPQPPHPEQPQPQPQPPHPEQPHPEQPHSEQPQLQPPHPEQPQPQLQPAVPVDPHMQLPPFLASPHGPQIGERQQFDSYGQQQPQPPQDRSGQLGQPGQRGRHGQQFGQPGQPDQPGPRVMDKKQDQGAHLEIQIERLPPNGQPVPQQQDQVGRIYAPSSTSAKPTSTRTIATTVTAPTPTVTEHVFLPAP